MRLTKVLTFQAGTQSGSAPEGTVQTVADWVGGAPMALIFVLVAMMIAGFAFIAWRVRQGVDDED